MVTQLTTPRSRRALLAGAAGGAAVLVADRLARPLGARAADGDTVRIGQTYDATSTTRIENNTTTEPVVDAFSGTGVGVVGHHGIAGEPPDLIGFPAGVFGYSDEGGGLVGVGVGAEGVIGRSRTGIGVHGQSLAAGDQPNPWGVFGSSENGTGVGGESLTMEGVFGRSDSGPGVWGHSESGPGVRASSTTGTALEVQGPVVFSSAGLGAVVTGKDRAHVSPGIGLGPDSKVLVTLLSDPGRRLLEWVAVHPAAGAFTVHLTGTVLGPPVRFAWFVIS
jgi:hypothetical protein